MSGSLPPGWYPAPGSPNVQQWWDGIRWSGEVRETENASDAEAATSDDRPAKAGAAPAGTPAGQAPADGAQGAPAAWRAPAVEAWQARTTPEPRQFRRWLGRAKRR